MSDPKPYSLAHVEALKDEIERLKSEADGLFAKCQRLSHDIREERYKHRTEIEAKDDFFAEMNHQRQKVIRENFRLLDEISSLRANMGRVRIERECAEKAEAEIKRLGKVVCGDHWVGLSCATIDGSEGCPWCIASQRESERSQAEAEAERLRALLRTFRGDVLCMADWCGGVEDERVIRILGAIDATLSPNEVE